MVRITTTDFSVLTTIFIDSLNEVGMTSAEMIFPRDSSSVIFAGWLQPQIAMSVNNASALKFILVDAPDVA